MSHEDCQIDIRFDAPAPYWSYVGGPTPSHSPPNSPMTDAEWRSFSPGMRREIWRTTLRQGKI